MTDTINIHSADGWESRKTSRRTCNARLALPAELLIKQMITLRENQEEPIRKAIAFFNEKNPKPSLIVATL